MTKPTERRAGTDRAAKQKHRSHQVDPDQLRREFGVPQPSVHDQIEDTPISREREGQQKER